MKHRQTGYDWNLPGERIKEIGNDETGKIQVSQIPVFGCNFVIGYDKSNQEETILTVGIRKDNDIYITKILKGEEAEELYRRLVE